MMRKNVVKVPRKNSANSAVGRKKMQINTEQEEDHVQDFYQSTPKNPTQNLNPVPSLALPAVNKKASKRPGSQRNRRENEEAELLGSPPIQASITEENKDMNRS